MTTLPDGLVLDLHPDVRVRDHGRTLIGGAPLRAVHLHPAAQRHLTGRQLTVTDATTARLASHLLGAGFVRPRIEERPDPDPAQITCVVPVKDRPGGLDRLLTSLGGSFPVIVVDDASHDTASMARVCRRHGAQLVRLATNFGPARARNTGLAHVRTAYVLFVDSDVTIDAHDVLRLARHLCDPGLAVVAPRVIGSTGQPGRVAAYEAARSSLDLGRHGALVHPRTRIGWLPSACLLARVEALSVGFDATMRVGEDVDLIWRIINAGWRVRYEPEVTARHEHGRTLLPWLSRKAFYGTGGAPLAARHGSLVAPAALTPLSAAIGVALLAQRRWSVPTAAALSAVMTARLARTMHGSPHPVLRAVELTGLGYTSTLGQTTSLLLRHWWPATAIVATRCRTIRRAVLVGAVTDTAIDYARTKPGIDPVSYALLRRLDDLAYGTGLWAGVLRGRSLTPLLPRLRAAKAR